MKTKISLGAAMFLFASISLAQTENYDLSGYKMPNLKRQTLTFGYGMNGSNDIFKLNYDLAEKRKSFRGGLSLNYSFYRNTEKWQQSVSTRVSGHYNPKNWNGDESSTFHEKSLSKEFYNSFYSLSRYYFTPSFFVGTVGGFVLPDYELSVSSSYNKGIIPGYVEQSTKSTHKSGSLSLSVGWGRIEPVQDYRQALFIIQDLIKEGKLNANMDEEKALEVARAVSKIRNRRFFDQRVKQKQAVEYIDSVLQALEVVEKADARYYTTLYDNWMPLYENRLYNNTMYEGVVERSAGHRLEVGVGPAINRFEYQRKTIEYLNDLEDLYESYNNYSTWRPFVNFTYEKPLNQALQFSVYNRFFTQYSKRTRTDTVTVVNNETSFRNMTTLNLGFYPTTRTNFNGSVGYFFYRNNVEMDTYKNNGFWAELSAYYYISPRFRLTTQLDFNQGHSYRYKDLNEERDSHSKRLDFNLGLNYSLF